MLVSRIVQLTKDDVIEDGQATYLSVDGHRLMLPGIDAHAGRNTARLALAADLPASVLADLTGISISTAERWSQWAKRDWAAYVGQRATDIDTGEVIGAGQQ